MLSTARVGELGRRTPPMAPKENRPIVSDELLKAITEGNLEVIEQLKAAALARDASSMIQKGVVPSALETVRILEQRLNSLVSEIEGLERRLGQAESRLEEIAEKLYENRRRS
jgi:hypothetical protein